MVSPQRAQLNDEIRPDKEDDEMRSVHARSCSIESLRNSWQSTALAPIRHNRNIVAIYTSALLYNIQSTFRHRADITPSYNGRQETTVWIIRNMLSVIYYSGMDVEIRAQS